MVSVDVKTTAVPFNVRRFKLTRPVCDNTIPRSHVNGTCDWVRNYNSCTTASRTLILIRFVLTIEDGAQSSRQSDQGHGRSSRPHARCTGSGTVLDALFFLPSRRYLLPQNRLKYLLPHRADASMPYVLCDIFLTARYSRTRTTGVRRQYHLNLSPLTQMYYITLIAITIRLQQSTLQQLSKSLLLPRNNDKFAAAATRVVNLW